MNLLVELFTKSLKVDYNEDEKEIYSNEANLWRGALSVGGKLILTNERLIFLPHNFNLGFGGKDEYVNLADINSARKVRTMDLIDNGLRITLSNEAELKFVVNINKREKWIEHLKQSNINVIEIKD